MGLISDIQCISQNSLCESLPKCLFSGFSALKYFLIRSLSIQFAENSEEEKEASSFDFSTQFTMIEHALLAFTSLVSPTLLSYMKNDNQNDDETIEILRLLSMLTQKIIFQESNDSPSLVTKESMALYILETQRIIIGWMDGERYAPEEAVVVSILFDSLRFLVQFPSLQASASSLLLNYLSLTKYHPHLYHEMWMNVFPGVFSKIYNLLAVSMRIGEKLNSSIGMRSLLPPKQPISISGIQQIDESDQNLSQTSFLLYKYIYCFTLYIRYFRLKNFISRSKYEFKKEIKSANDQDIFHLLSHFIYLSIDKFCI